MRPFSPLQPACGWSPMIGLFGFLHAALLVSPAARLSRPPLSDRYSIGSAAGRDRRDHNLEMPRPDPTILDDILKWSHPARTCSIPHFSS